jgi:hypothetical protein
VTVHVAIGTDVIHMHPGFDAAKTGAASHLDFRLLAGQVRDLEGGVFINAGSAVILPEVFLKAVNVARNLGFRVTTFTAVNLDFIRHYRPMVNVVRRPTAGGGTGINLVGHHEILLPLIAAGVISTRLSINAHLRAPPRHCAYQRTPHSSIICLIRAPNRSVRFSNSCRISSPSRQPILVKSLLCICRYLVGMAGTFDDFVKAGNLALRFSFQR